MRPTWLVAKYIEDVRRREPRNVGVLLFTDEGVIDRVVGQRNDGEIDGRSTPLGGPHLANYQAWVAYWRTSAKLNARDPRAGRREVGRCQLLPGARRRAAHGGCDSP